MIKVILKGVCMSKKDKDHKKEKEKQKENIEPQKEEQEQKNKEIDELQKCQEELKELNEKYLRAAADFENYKKRLEREKKDAVAFANEIFARDLLSVIDSFESALASFEKIEGSEAVEKIKEGLLLTYDQLLKVLKKHGVEEIENEGIFDPNVHQVIQQVDSDKHESGEIVQVLQKGYTLKGRVLRPSMVSTSK